MLNELKTEEILAQVPQLNEQSKNVSHGIH